MPPRNDMQIGQIWTINGRQMILTEAEQRGGIGQDPETTLTFTPTQTGGLVTEGPLEDTHYMPNIYEEILRIPQETHVEMTLDDAVFNADMLREINNNDNEHFIGNDARGEIEVNHEDWVDDQAELNDEHITPENIRYANVIQEQVQEALNDLDTTVVTAVSPPPEVIENIDIDFVGDEQVNTAAAEILHVGEFVQRTSTAINASWRYNLTDEFKEVLKPFIQEIIKECMESEGFIIGHMPCEEA